MKTTTLKLNTINIKLLDNKDVFMPSKRSILLAKSLFSLNFKNARVIDVGTGSGFLAIACAALGAKEILATDIDPHALIAIRKNWKLNKLKTNLAIKTCNVLEDIKVKDFKEKFDFVISNPPALPLEVMDKIKLKSFEPWLFNGSGKGGRLFTDKLLKTASFFLKPGGSLVFIHSSRLGFEKTKKILNKHFLKWEVLEEADFELEDRFLPFISFWKADREKVFQKDNKFFENIKIIKATKHIAKQH